MLINVWRPISTVESAPLAVCDASTVRREDLFLQTKFTYAGGQDHRLPYDPRADPATQVRQSFASSLEHLGTIYLDSYLLHGPSTPLPWGRNVLKSGNIGPCLVQVKRSVEVARHSWAFVRSQPV